MTPASGTTVADLRAMKKGSRFLFTVVVIVSAACATNPVTGKKQMSLLSEVEEIAIGQQQDVEIRREMGVYGDQALQRYVSDIGQELARVWPLVAGQIDQQRLGRPRAETV